MEAYGFKDQDFIEDNLLTEDCCCCSVTELSLTLWDPMDCSMPGFSVLHCLLELAQTLWVSDVIQPSHPVAPFSCLQSFPASGSFPISRLFTSASILWSFNTLKHQSFQCSGLISFRIDWFDLLAIQGTLKSLLQHHNPKVSILWHSAFFMVQLPHLYTTTGKTIALTVGTFVSKVMSLLFNMLSRLVIFFQGASVS